MKAIMFLVIYFKEIGKDKRTKQINGEENNFVKIILKKRRRNKIADMFADNLVKRMIREIIFKKDTLSRNEEVWFNMTKCMLKNYEAREVWDRIQQALVEVSDEQWFEHKYPRGFHNDDWNLKPKIKSVIKINLRDSRRKKMLNDNLNITDVAKLYGLKVKANKCVCPFHADKDPSLSFSDDKNVFNCFGCGAKGDVVTFIKRLEGVGLEKIEEVKDARNTRP